MTQPSTPASTPKATRTPKPAAPNGRKAPSTRGAAPSRAARSIKATPTAKAPTGTLSGPQAPVAVYAGPEATLGKDGRVLALTASVYPEIEEAEGLVLWCAGCREDHPISRFAFVTKRNAGKGRMAECRKAQVARLARNVEAKKAGKATAPAPKLPADRVVTA